MEASIGLRFEALSPMQLGLSQDLVRFPDCFFVALLQLGESMVKALQQFTFRTLLVIQGSGNLSWVTTLLESPE